jgi:hypothetical protein
MLLVFLMHHALPHLRGPTFALSRLHAKAHSAISCAQRTNKKQSQRQVGSGDSPCVDLYTNQIVRYEDAFLIFPSAYYHHRHTDPPNAPPASAGKGNDGVLAVRLAYARTPTDEFSYLNPAEPEAEWIPRGQGRFLPADWRFVGGFDAGYVHSLFYMLTLAHSLTSHSSSSSCFDHHSPLTLALELFTHWH